MSNNNDRILDMYTVLINQVYLSHTRFLETVNFLEQGIRQIHNSYNNSPHSNNRNNNPRYTNNFNNNNNLHRSNFRNVDYLYNQNRLNRMTPNHRHQRGFTETHDLTQLFSNMLANQPTFDLNNLSPVIVRPSQQQIQNATEEINNTETSHLICPITQENFEENTSIIRITHCQHCFSREALLNWFNRSVLCPVCRYDIRDFSNNSIPTDSSNNTIPFQRTTSMESNTSQNSNMEHFLNTFTSQISESLSQYIINNDISLNNLDNRALNLEYTIQTPNNVFTISSMSPESIGNIMRRMNNANNNDQNNN
jgi:hypothetical protein